MNVEVLSLVVGFSPDDRPVGQLVMDFYGEFEPSRRCPKCGENKQVSEFAVGARKGWWCKACICACHRSRRRRDPVREWIMQTTKSGRRHLRPLLRSMLEERGFRCECCGVAFDFEASRNSMRSPTIDQIIPGAGYQVDNVALLCRLCNTRKSTNDAESLENLLRFIKNA